MSEINETKLSFYTQLNAKSSFAEFLEAKTLTDMTKPIKFSNYGPGDWYILLYNGHHAKVEFVIEISLQGNRVLNFVTLLFSAYLDLYVYSNL